MTERGHKFIGRKYAEEELVKAGHAIEKWRKEAEQPVEGELEKTEFDLKIIATAEQLLRDTLKLLGVGTEFYIKPEQVHLLSEDSPLARAYSDRHGWVNNIAGAVFIKRDTTEMTIEYLSHMLHEFIHLVATTRFYVSPEKDVSDIRVGYRITSPWKKNWRDRFRGLDEFITETLVYLAFLDRAEFLEKEFGTTRDEINEGNYTYQEYGETVYAIMDKLADQKGLPVAEGTRNFLRGLFANTVLVLKDIDKAFGKGALRILSSLGSFENPEENEENRKKVEEFFTIEDLARREELRKELLGVFTTTKKPQEDNS